MIFFWSWNSSALAQTTQTNSDLTSGLRLLNYTDTTLDLELKNVTVN